MSYLIQSRMAQDYGLIMRIAACAAVEGIVSNQLAWADERRLRYAATPGWASAWETALLNEVANPGEDPGVISDGMILARTQQIIAEDSTTPPTPDEPKEPEPLPEEPGPEPEAPEPGEPGEGFEEPDQGNQEDQEESEGDPA